MERNYEMKITRTAIATNLVVAALLAFGNIAMAKEPSGGTAELKPCKSHDSNATNCHIHDQKVFLHMRLSDANEAGGHARNEYKALQRLHQQQRRD